IATLKFTQCILKKDMYTMCIIRGIIAKNYFFSRENYLFFTKKIRTHILPHADILAWCLMPNHFHLMVYVHTPVITRDGIVPRDATLSRVPRNGNPTTLN